MRQHRKLAPSHHIIIHQHPKALAEIHERTSCVWAIIYLPAAENSGAAQPFTLIRQAKEPILCIKYPLRIIRRRSGVFSQLYIYFSVLHTRGSGSSLLMYAQPVGVCVCAHLRVCLRAAANVRGGCGGRRTSAVWFETDNLRIVVVPCAIQSSESWIRQHRRSAPGRGSQLWNGKLVDCNILV